MIIISLSILNEEKMAFNINFRVLTLETVLKGLKILKMLKLFRFEDGFKYVMRLETTIRKSSLFQVSLM